MDTNEAVKVLMTTLEGSVNAKLMPLGQRMAGYELAILCVISALHAKGSLDLDQLVGVISDSRKACGIEADSQVAKALDSLVLGIESLKRGQSPVVH